MVVALDEVIDNSIRANATLISLKLLDDGGGQITGLVFSDDGVGCMCLLLRSACYSATAFFRQSAQHSVLVLAGGNPGMHGYVPPTV